MNFLAAAATGAIGSGLAPRPAASGQDVLGVTRHREPRYPSRRLGFAEGRD